MGLITLIACWILYTETQMHRGGHACLPFTLAPCARKALVLRYGPPPFRFVRSGTPDSMTALRCFVLCRLLYIPRNLESQVLWTFSRLSYDGSRCHRTRALSSTCVAQAARQPRPSCCISTVRGCAQPQPPCNRRTRCILVELDPNVQDHCDIILVG